jgi:hypothetical protein
MTALAELCEYVVASLFEVAPSSRQQRSQAASAMLREGIDTPPYTPPLDGPASSSSRRDPPVLIEFIVSQWWRSALHVYSHLSTTGLRTVQDPLTRVHRTPVPPPPLALEAALPISPGNLVLAAPTLPERPHAQRKDQHGRYLLEQIMGHSRVKLFRSQRSKSDGEGTICFPRVERSGQQGGVGCLRQCCRGCSCSGSAAGSRTT